MHSVFSLGSLVMHTEYSFIGDLEINMKPDVSRKFTRHVMEGLQLLCFVICHCVNSGNHK